MWSPKNANVVSLLAADSTRICCYRTSSDLTVLFIASLLPKAVKEVVMSGGRTTMVKSKPLLAS